MEGAGGALLAGAVTRDGGVRRGRLSLVSNQQLVDAWERALDVAGKAGRVDEIEAAEDAGRAARRDERHQHDSVAARDGSEEAVRSATLAVGVRDLLTDDDYRTLTAAWQQVMGSGVL